MENKYLLLIDDLEHRLHIFHDNKQFIFFFFHLKYKMGRQMIMKIQKLHGI